MNDTDIKEITLILETEKTFVDLQMLHKKRLRIALRKVETLCSQIPASLRMDEIHETIRKALILNL